jgi:imidazolonepropionase-like amidohydrolase
MPVLHARRLFDGTAASMHADATIVIDGDRITRVKTGVPAPAGAQLVDTVLPGLVDSHVHLAFDASPDPVATLAARDDAEVLAAMRAAGRAAVKGGITTVRDLGERGYLSLALRDATASDPTLPTIVASGPPITTPGGHCHFLGGAAEGVDGVRTAVRQHAERGVDVIKVMVSGGNLTPGSRPEMSQYGPAELRAAVDEAHRLGLPVVAHAHAMQSVADALAAGVDGLEHVTFMTADGVDEIPDDLLAALAAGPVVIGTTLGVVPGTVPHAAIAARMPNLVANLRRMYQAGATMIPGTDAGLGPGKPHDVLRYAIGHLGLLGFSPVAALQAATAGAAAAIGLGERKGRVAPGYDADLLIVDGDPLTEPDALHRIKAVYVRGVAATCGK